MGQTNRRLACQAEDDVARGQQRVLNWTFVVATRDLEERHFHFLFEILIQNGSISGLRRLSARHCCSALTPLHGTKVDLTATCIFIRLAPLAVAQLEHPGVPA